MSHQATVKVEFENWTTLEQAYDLDFIRTAIHAYEHSKEYHDARNARINAAVARAKADGTY